MRFGGPVATPPPRWESGFWSAGLQARRGGGADPERAASRSAALRAATGTEARAPTSPFAADAYVLSRILMPQTKHTFCRICEALCGLEVDVEGNAIVDIRPDAAHVATDGFGCMKGLKQHKLFGSPDRVTRPLKRVGRDWQQVSWAQALGEIGAKVRQLRGDHHPNAIAMYVGTAAGFGVLHPVFAQGFMDGVGSKSMYASATQDCANKFAAARHVYGFPFTQPFPDVDRTECLIVVGANPVISKWSFLQVSNPAKRLKEIVARGGRLFFVDPRRTESAKVAGEHVFIRPGTDVFFYLSFLNALLASGGVDRARVARHMTGFAEVARLAEAWPPERTAAGDPHSRPTTLREMVDGLPHRARRRALQLDRRQHGRQRRPRLLDPGGHQRRLRQPRPRSAARWSGAASWTSPPSR